jgi:DNA-binding Lrp family transcriptional regulator
MSPKGLLLPGTIAAGARMVEAFVLIQAEPGLMGQSVSNEVASIKGVLSAEDLSGPYDVIARVEARDLDQLGRLVVARIQALPGITRTLTCPVVHLK